MLPSGGEATNPYVIRNRTDRTPPRGPELRPLRSHFERLGDPRPPGSAAPPVRSTHDRMPRAAVCRYGWYTLGSQPVQRPDPTYGPRLVQPTGTEPHCALPATRMPLPLAGVPHMIRHDRLLLDDDLPVPVAESGKPDRSKPFFLGNHGAREAGEQSMPLRGDFGSGPAEVFPERFRYYPRVRNTHAAAMPAPEKSEILE